MKRITLILSGLISASILNTGAQDIRPEVEIWGLFEIGISNSTVYGDPFRDVELLVEITGPGGEILHHYGFYDGEDDWKIRFSPNETGRWICKARFSDGSGEMEDTLTCISTEKPGRVMLDPFNPYWLTRANRHKYLFRSFHVGDRFFAGNWDDPTNLNDGEYRTIFLDWLQENKYNMLSVASHYTNRNDEGRGKGWDTPQLWPLDPAEYNKMEQILDTLNKRDITVFPFAGFFGYMGSWPTDAKEQELYIKYTLARIGHYPNIILNLAGPEPFYREDEKYYKGALRMVDVKRLGQLIDSLDMHNHVLTFHHQKQAARYGDPLLYEPWYDMSTLQGPTTTDLETLYTGLMMNHPPYKACYAQETLWPGNKNHPDYTDDEIRKNMLTILFSGSTLNYADMEGNSSSGFSGSLDLIDADPGKHEIAKEVWDWFETIPFHKMTARHDMVSRTYCLAEEGVEYYVFPPVAGKKIGLFLNFPYKLESEWINVNNPEIIRKGDMVNQKTSFTAPDGGETWILHVSAPRPKVVATGNFPDLATDADGNIHLVYNRGGLIYKKYDAATKSWSEEQKTGCLCETVERSDPDVVVDSKGNPHVFCGNQYAWFNGKKWVKAKPTATRDSELAIDSRDNVFLVSRKGNNGGYIGFEKKIIAEKDWIALTDPDKNNRGKNDHVYTDIVIDGNDDIHLVQRHGPAVEVTYRKSEDGGFTWPIEEKVMDEREEAPHIIVNSEGKVFISTGAGFVLERMGTDNWKQHGRKLHIHARMQPEPGIDKQDNIYMAAFGGHYNVLRKGFWIGEKIIDPVTKNNSIGFVETAGQKDFVYIAWEEGIGNPDAGFKDDSKIVVGILYPDGRIIGLF